MKFILFSEIIFKIPDPIALIECYCYQNDFYAKYDLLKNRKIEDVNKIGARIKKNVLLECKKITERTKNLSIFKYNLDNFLDLAGKDGDKQVKELNEIVIQKLLNINGIGLSTATKILHTLYPKIIPMIDSLLQKKYREEINNAWEQKRAEKIFIDFYNNLKIKSNRKNLNYLFDKLLENNIQYLSKIRIFDILWWSYLKAEKLRGENGIDWNTIEF